MPMDAEAIRAPVRRTGRLLVSDEAPPTRSAAVEIIALVIEDPDTFRHQPTGAKRLTDGKVFEISASQSH
jgi:pyruvate/2-oxoglutarate/acetoin dehydrogenase E1 component